MGMLLKYVFRVLFWAGAIMAFTAGVPPQEASSNIAAWFNIVGVRDLPTWLVSETTNTIVFIAGIIFILATLSWWLYVRIRRNKELVPLSLAARRVFEELKAMGNSAHIQNTHQFYTPEEKLNYIASAMSQYIQYYAQYPPSTRMEPVKEHHLYAGDFHDSGDTFKLHGNPAVFFQNCAVRESEIQKAINELGVFKI